MKNKEDIFKQGIIAGKGLRGANNYVGTQDSVDRNGITDEALNNTPPIGLNLKLLAENVWAMNYMRRILSGKHLNATVLGLAIARGVKNVDDFLGNDLKAHTDRLNVFDIDKNIIAEVQSLNYPQVNAQLRDARQTELPDNSQDIVIRDHLGNCCPPEIDQDIDQEVSRILKPGGLSVVNITTSERLRQSEGREVLPFNRLQKIESESDIKFIKGLNGEIYNLSELEGKHPHLAVLRSKLVEIGQGESFVVFGEDPDGHAEWFRSFDSHFNLWRSNGMEVQHSLHRTAGDSHKPPLMCRRHIVVLEKEKV